MTNEQIKNELIGKGYTIRADRFLQKNLGNGWYPTVDLETNVVEAVNYLESDDRDGHRAYDYKRSNHKRFQLAGITSNKGYVRNKEAHRVPNHIIVGWAELLENRLK
jgi:hypothetical protein